MENQIIEINQAPIPSLLEVLTNPEWMMYFSRFDYVFWEYEGALDTNSTLQISDLNWSSTSVYFSFEELIIIAKAMYYVCDLHLFGFDSKTIREFEPARLNREELELSAAVDMNLLDSSSWTIKFNQLSE